jgi:uncharacterized protein YukE
MSDIEVDPDALDDHAKRWDDKAESASGWNPVLRSAELGRESFGYIPGIGNRVWDAYEQLRNVCQQVTTDAVDVMSAVGDGLRKTAENHRQVEELIRARTERIEAGLDPMDGVRG